MDINEFMAEQPPSRRHKSALWNHSEAIRTLREKGYTVANIQKYLAANGVTVSAVRIHHFITRDLGMRKNTTKALDTHPAPPKPRTTGSSALATRRTDPLVRSEEPTPEDMTEFARLRDIGQST